MWLDLRSRSCTSFHTILDPYLYILYKIYYRYFNEIAALVVKLGVVKRVLTEMFDISTVGEESMT